MARLQDYPLVTPTSSDKFLIVQSQGQGLATIENMLGISEYSTTEKVVGKWIDGKTIYRKVTTGLSLTTTANAWCDTGVSSANTPTIMSGRVIDTSGQVFPCAVGRLSGNFAINIPLARSNISTLILEYIKS